MTDPRLAARNAAIILVFIGTLLAFGAWHLLRKVTARKSALSELEWWIIGVAMAAFELTLLLAVGLR